MRIFYLAGLFMLGLCWNSPAHSVESIRFHSANEFRMIPFGIREIIHIEDMEFSIIDLNKDGRGEWIARQQKQACSPDTGCLYYIFAQKWGVEWIEIGSFKGFNIIVADKTQNGVRNILVYNLPHNDFVTVTYSWSPEKYRYEARA